MEEIDALAPEQTNKITFADGTSSTCSLLCDLIHLEGAQCVASYESNFYAGMPAITKNQYGKGFTYYIGTNPTEDGIVKVLDMAVQTAGVASVVTDATGLEITCRKTSQYTYYFIFNFKDKVLPLPENFISKQDLLTGETIPEDFHLKQYDALLVASPNTLRGKK